MSSTSAVPSSVPMETEIAASAQSVDYPLAGESIVCFAGEDWWYHHPHSKNHILKRLAKHNRVLFVNSITMGLPSIGNPDFFHKIRRKLRSYMRWLRKAPEGLWVMTPINVPLYGSAVARALNRLLLVVQLRLVMFFLNLRRPIVWVAIPTAADLVNSLGAKLLVYQVSDKYDVNEDSALSRAVIRDMDTRLKKQAAVVMYSGRKLYEEAEPRHRYFLEQAVDYERFANLPPGTPADIAAIPRPVLNPFDVYLQGEDVLVRELSALDVGRVRDIAVAFGFLSPSAASGKTRDELTPAIIAGVRQPLAGR